MTSLLKCILFLGLVSFAVPNHIFSANDEWRHFSTFQSIYKKKYQTFEEFQYRFETFCTNIKTILMHNSNESNTFKMSVNQFADMTHDEFTNWRRTGYKNVQNNKNNKNNKKNKSYSVKKGRLSAETCVPFNGTFVTDATKMKLLPSAVDWRTKAAVTPVKDQGQCGSCWSFSSTGAMEGAWAIAKGELVNLSEQQLMDCSRKYGNQGCNGGDMDPSFIYAIQSGGMCKESDYSYQAVDSFTCKKCKPVAQFTKCADVTPNNQLALKEAVSIGPVSVAIDANSKLFQFYSSGVITDATCGTTLDHGVLTVGYGDDNEIKYWLVKNSWSDSWGDKGYVKIARSESINDAGICGIAMDPSFPIV